MDEGSVVRLVIACGVGGFLGGVGGMQEQSYGGAHMFAGFALLATLGAWSNNVGFSWLEVVAPIVFAYGAAAASISIAKQRR